MAEINRELIKILEPIYAHDCDGSKFDILPEALLSVESALLMKSRHELETRSNTSALAYLALAEAYEKRTKEEENKPCMSEKIREAPGSVRMAAGLMANMIMNGAPEEEMERAIAYSIECMDEARCFRTNDIQELMDKYGW